MGVLDDLQRSSFQPHVDHISNCWLLASHLNFGYPQKRIKIQQIDPGTFLASISVISGVTFWYTFLSISRLFLKLFFCNMYQAKHLFLPSKSVHFRSKFRSIYVVSSGLVFRHLLFIKCPAWLPKHDVGTPFGIQLSLKWDPKKTHHTWPSQFVAFLEPTFSWIYSDWIFDDLDRFRIDIFNSAQNVDGSFVVLCIRL